MTRRGIAGWVACAALAAAVFVPWSALAPAARAGDAVIAATLFKSGKQAFQKGDHATAISFFNKAYEENSDLIEACWWRASAQEKSGDKGAALASYREYLERVAAKATGDVTKEEQRLKGLAEKSVDSLAAGEKEFKKSEDAYVASLLQFAKDNFVRDPGVSLKALGYVLDVRPDHEEAQKLRAKLGGGAAAPAKGDPAPASGPFKGVKEWRDQIAETVFKSEGIVEYADSELIVDCHVGKVIGPNQFVDLGNSYAYESDVKIATAHDRGWLTGLVFGLKNGQLYVAMIQTSSVKLVRMSLSGGQTDLASYPMSLLDISGYHRFGVIVKGPAVDVWLDGKKVVSWKDAAGADLVGDIGLFQQACRTQTRVLRSGKVE